MIIPMLVKIDFGALARGADALARHRRHALRQLGGQAVLDGVARWIFIRHVFAPWLPAEQLDSYVAGLILLAAAPCTAMVFVWSQLSDGDPYFTLSQVALNDAIMVFAFAPIVALLLGLRAITVPWDTLLTSVVLYIVVPRDRRAALCAGALLAAAPQALERGARGDCGRWSIAALLLTLVLLFAFQGEAILASRWSSRCWPSDPDPGLPQRRARLPGSIGGSASRIASPGPPR